jgi:tRNA A-37 threonylcarbamoyl transferase component Bud32
VFQPEAQLEAALRDLPSTGTCIKRHAYRQVWRFELSGKPYYLKFYPAPRGFRDHVRRKFRGSPAMYEFTRLQWLQKATVPAPRAVAVLMGFTLEGRKGDALILEGIEPSIPLDRYLSELELQGREAPDHLQLVRHLIDLLEKLGRAGLGHRDLHLGNLLLHGGRLFLMDAYAVQRGGLTMSDLYYLAASSRPFANRADLQRAWSRLGPGGPLPSSNPRAPKVWRNQLARATYRRRYVDDIQGHGWTGRFFTQYKFPHRWSTVSPLTVTEQDWQQAWPDLLARIESDQLEILKRGPSGDVLAGQITLAGKPLHIVVKRPRRKFWYRYVNEIGRGSRSTRAWAMAWRLIVRNVPTAWPMLIMEKRKLGYVTDSLIVLERIEGKTLSWPGWKQMGAAPYHDLLRRAGRLLRLLEGAGLYLYDAKADNWMVRDDPVLGLVPVLIDTDGLRRLNRSGGLSRLLRSLRENRDLNFNESDERALLLGYSPFAKPHRLAQLAGRRPSTPPVSSLPARGGARG